MCASGNPKDRLVSGAFFLVRSLDDQRMNTAAKLLLCPLSHKPELCPNGFLLIWIISGVGDFVHFFYTKETNQRKLPANLLLPEN